MIRLREVAIIRAEWPRHRYHFHTGRPKLLGVNMIQHVWFYIVFIRFLLPKPLFDGGAVFFAVWVFSTVPLLSDARNNQRHDGQNRKGSPLQVVSSRSVIWPRKKIFIGSSYVCEISTCFLSTNVETAEIYNRNGKRVYTSNCENMETSIFIIVSAESSRFPKLTQFFQAMLRLVCDTQYVSGKDTLFPFTNSPIHGFSQLDVVTCCDNRWRHCFVTSLHRWWTEWG
jgi:hypothetical protein